MEKPKTYRLREVPYRLDRLGIAELLSHTLGDVATSEIRILSLATARHAERQATKTATLVFKKLPSLVMSREGKNQWGSSCRIAGSTSGSGHELSRYHAAKRCPG